jgi:P-type Mg2+ transporter
MGDEAARRLVAHGQITITAYKKSSIVGLVLSQFKSPINMISLFAMIVSALLGDWAGSAFILIIILGSDVLNVVIESIP